MTNVPQGFQEPTRETARRIVLIVDDSAAQRRQLSIQLSRAGFEVFESPCARSALKLCIDIKPDFVLSDWVMSGMSGPELCGAFRSLQRERYGYFVLLTSKDCPEEIALGMESGADDFLTKPVGSAELVARLSAGERILRMEEALHANNERLQVTLNRLRSAQSETDRDLEEARRLQQGLLRQPNDRLGACNLSMLLRPAGHIGGDLIGYFPIDARRAGLFAIDVSGHGIAAALLTARLAGHLTGSGTHNIALRTTPMGLYDALSPRDLVLTLNELLLNEMRTESYLTMIYAEVDFISGEGKLVQAGHPHPIIQRIDGQVEALGNGGLPVGVFEAARYEETPFSLKPGDRLLLASDGITEAESPGGHQLGEDGLSAFLQTNLALQGEALIESLSWAVSNFTSGRRDDDMSALLLEFLPR